MVKVSIILPAYNAADTIGEAIESIIRQTWTDWELIVINDGSTDRTKDVILSYKDERIRYVENIGNKGLVYTLNRGIELATGEYIARMDADDYSLSTRIEKQVAYLDTHPNVIVLGTAMETFGKGIRPRRIFPQEHNDNIKGKYLTDCPFIHPSVMMRPLPTLRYDADFPDAEDYRLWLTLMKYGEFHNLQEVLLHYRISPTQITRQNNPRQQRSTQRCRWEYLGQYIGTTAAAMQRDGITLKHIKTARKCKPGNDILRALYLSLPKYDLRTCIFSILSLDIFRLGLLGMLRFFKRTLTGPAPYLYPIDEND